MPRGGSLTLRIDNLTLTATDLAAMADARPGRFLRLSVTDTGEGMSEETLQHLFEPFFTTKEVGKGTGLGLATVYGIVHQHKGWVTVTSALGQGTTFLVYLPVSEESTDVAREEEASRLSTTGRGETILLVEDETSLRTTMAIALRHHGYKVLEAPDGPAAVRLWQEHSARIDLLLTDIIMPGGMSGHELAAQLLAQEPRLKIIFTSGYTGNSAATDAQLVEGSNFIRKPFAPEALAKIIRDKLASPATPA
jgi:CheY-like chemotaxis protein